jgi:hypothetical protein
MKRAASLVIVLITIIYFGSCKKINCSTPVIKHVLFYSSLSTNVVPDTAAQLDKYRKGSLFNLLADEYININLTKVDFNRQMDFPDKGADVYDYDWLITLKPSGRVYKITEIKHESSTSKTSDCTNTVTYKVNDSLFTVPGNPYSSIPNFPSDIQIQYF